MMIHRPGPADGGRRGSGGVGRAGMMWAWMVRWRCGPPARMTC